MLLGRKSESQLRPLAEQLLNALEHLQARGIASVGGLFFGWGVGWLFFGGKGVVDFCVVF